MVDITTGLAFLTGLGLPQILLWVLTFAVVFEILSKLGIMRRAPAALVSIVVGFLVLMAVPAALIAVIASMSTGLIALAIGLVVLIALLEVAGVRHIVPDKEGKPHGFPYLSKHSTTASVVLLILAAIIFVTAGGLGLIGISSLPVIGMGTWLLVIIGIAVLWMISEAG